MNFVTKKLVVMSLIINMGLLAYVGFTTLRTPCLKDSASKNIIYGAGVQKKHAIAVLLPASHPSLDQIQLGFTQTLEKQGLACDVTVYNANGNRTLMRSQVEEMIQKKHDLIFTIGSTASQMACEVTRKKQAQIPVVFSAIESGAFAADLVRTTRDQETFVTGITSDNNFNQQLELLAMLKPGIKNVLLVYDPTTKMSIEADKQEIEQLLRAKNIQLTILEVTKTNQVYERTQTMVAGVDAILVLKDHTVVPAIDSLIKICNRSGIALYCSELDSVAKGAALGFGVSSYSTGAQAAEKALSVLRDGKHPSKVLVTQECDCKLALNMRTMEQQGLSINKNLLFLMQSSLICDVNTQVTS
jgi:putative ABC transport system substrate-binding protein